MERRRDFGVVAGGAFGGTQVLQAAPGKEQEDCGRSHTKWVADAMIRMLTIKIGMTRKKLLTVFTTEGGISTRLGRIYVSKDCPFFRVNVEFEAVGEPGQDQNGASLAEGEDDLITKISEPYLQFSITD